KRPLDYPNVVHLELSSRCNANCKMCPHHRLSRPRRDMPTETARRVILDWPPGDIDRASLFFFGEPLLQPDLVELVVLLGERQPRAMIYLTTNGQLLTPELSAELWRAGLNALAVSYQGDDPGLHEQLMRGIVNETVERNIFAAEAARRRINPRAVFKINSLLLPETTAREQAIRELWSRRDIPLELTPVHEEYRILDPTEPVEALRQRPCPQIFDSVTVYAHGAVGFCCSDPDASLSIGDVNEEPLGRIWLGRKAAELRRRQLTGNFSREPICASCTYDLLRGPVF
ncbi:MAG: radical SAM protein, partial [Candidatus Coatesbacteria bacterium]|nr:radical SAM protein [Candidatus Coatesbacteria bacterium]